MRRTMVSLLVLILLSISLQAMAGIQKKILCTAFPIYQITRNIVAGRNGVSVQPLLPAALGCPHDYALTPGDMQKLAKADVLIANGLGLEEYLGAPVKRANPKIRIIDSSSGIEEILHYPEGDANPHLFASPRMAAKLAANIADELSRLDPGGAETYLANSKKYSAEMNKLADELAVLGKRLSNNRIVAQHGVFDYLARDMGLELTAVIQAHPGQTPSASEIFKIIDTIKEKKVGAIFSEPQYPAKLAQTIAREAGIAAAELDPAASGPEDAPLDYYETAMRRNMRVLEKTLGTK